MLASASNTSARPFSPCSTVAQRRLADRDRGKDAVQVCGTHANEAGTTAGRRERPDGDPAPDRVDADPEERGGLLEREPFRDRLAPFGWMAGHSVPLHRSQMLMPRLRSWSGPCM